MPKSPTKPNVTRLSSQEVIAKLTKKNATPNCEICGHHNWVAGIISQAFVLFLQGIPIYLLVCNHCGNMRFHAASVVERE